MDTWALSKLHKRINRKDWERVRRFVLDRENWRCQWCGGYGNEVDHIHPLEHGGDEVNPQNLQTLCVGCHLAKTRGDRNKYKPHWQQAWDELLQNRLTEY